MSGYQTYVCGANALFYDKIAVDALKDSLNNLFWWGLSYCYLSCWRNLHVDGFEGYIWNRRELPKHQEIRFKFFEYVTTRE